MDDGDSMGLYSEHDQFVLQWYCRYLVKALQIALEKLPSITWEASCKEAIDMVNKEEGWARPVLTCSRTLQRFHLRYRKNKECILNKHLINTNKTKSRVDKLFDAYPDAKSSMETFMRSHLNELSCELVWDRFHEKILPKLVDERKQERIENGDAAEDPANADFGSKEFLSELGLSVVSVPTVYRWMRRLGQRTKSSRGRRHSSNSLTMEVTLKVTGPMSGW